MSVNPPTPGAPISEGWGREVTDALRRNTMQSGSGARSASDMGGSSVTIPPPLRRGNPLRKHPWQTFIADSSARTLYVAAGRWFTPDGTILSYASAGPTTVDITLPDTADTYYIYVVPDSFSLLVDFKNSADWADFKVCGCDARCIATVVIEAIGPGYRIQPSSIIQCLHDDVEAGGSAGAVDPVVDLGGSTEGDEAILEDTWDVGNVDENEDLLAVNLRVLCRVVYNESGDHKVYGYYREMLYDTSGKLNSISAETKVEIENPISHGSL